MLEWMRELFDSLGEALMHLLPLSPFTGIIEDLEQMPFLGYINWFIPIGSMLKIGAAWLVAIGVYYSYSMVARWIKVIS